MYLGSAAVDLNGFIVDMKKCGLPFSSVVFHFVILEKGKD